MAAVLSYLRDFNFISVLVRLLLAMLCGGLIGMERETRRAPAGFRTYMLVCLGATLAMLISQYEVTMMNTQWAAIANEVGSNTDVSRLGAQVVNGIGFLGAGTILVTAGMQVRGLTTAAGLWASACMGLAVGAGFYECVIPACILIFLCVRYLTNISSFIQDNAKIINIYVEFESLDHLSDILERMSSQDLQVFDVDVDRAEGRNQRASHPSIVFSVNLKRRMTHEQILASLSDLNGIRLIREV